jgi:hypothetical protein
MAGKRVCSMISIMQVRARAQNTLLVRVQSVRSGGRMRGSRGLNEDSSTLAKDDNSSSDAPDNLDRSELRELIRGREMDRTDEINWDGNCAAPFVERDVRREMAFESLSHVSSVSGIERSC